MFHYLLNRLHSIFTFGDATGDELPCEVGDIEFLIFAAFVIYRAHKNFLPVS
jgi:hypothetical protein